MASRTTVTKDDGSDMTPRFAMNDRTYAVLANAIFSGEGGLLFTLFNAKAYLDYLWNSKLLPAKRSTLDRCVCHIFGLCAQKKAVRIAARSPITLMANFHASRDGAKVNLPGYAMSEDFNPIIATHQSVSRISDGSCPNPTLVERAGSDVLPKTLFGGMLAHVNSLLSDFDHATGRLQALRWQLYWGATPVIVAQMGE